MGNTQIAVAVFCHLPHIGKALAWFFGGLQSQGTLALVFCTPHPTNPTYPPHIHLSYLPRLAGNACWPSCPLFNSELLLHGAFDGRHRPRCQKRPHGPDRISGAHDAASGNMATHREGSAAREC